MSLLVTLGQLWAFAFVGLLGSELLGAEAGLRAWTQVVFALPLVAWAAWRLRGPRRPLDWAILAALGASAVVALASADPQGSREALGLAVMYALAFWAMRDAGAIPRLRTALAVAASLALTAWLVMAAAFWLIEKADWARITGATPGLESAQVFIWGTTNVFPVMSLVALPFIMWQRAGPVRLALLVTWGLASLVVVPLSMGRAGWLAFGVAILAHEALGGWPHLRRLTGDVPGPRTVSASAVALAGVALVAAAVIGSDGIAALVGGDRLRIWSQAMGVFGADPLTGAGPSTFSWIRLDHVPDLVEPVGVRLAHNAVMQTLADGGLLLALGFGAVIIAFLREALGHMADPRRRLGLAVLVGFGVASLLDDFSSLPAVVVTVLAIAAWIVAPPEPERSMGRRGWLAPAVLVVLGAVALPAVLGVDAARQSAAAGRAAAVQGDWDAARNQFQAAAAAYPRNAGYQLGLGLAAWRAGDTPAAIEAYEAAFSLHRADGRAAGALAELKATDDAERMALLDLASRRRISDPQYAVRLGDTLWAGGDQASAIESYGLAVAVDTRLIAAFAGGGPDELAVADAARLQAERLEALDGYVGRGSVSHDLALRDGTVDARAPAAWRAVAMAVSGDIPGARAIADAALRQAPGDRRALQAAAAVACLGGEVERARALADLAGDIRPTRPSEVREVRDHTYRDLGLGSYQPLAADPYPAPQPWPWSLVDMPPGGC